MNGDGFQDVVTSDSFSTAILIHLGNGNSSFRASLTLSATNVQSSFIEDVDRDGKADILAVANDTVLVFKGNGNGTFTAAKSYFTGGYSNWVEFGEFNGDGKLDIITTNPIATSVLLGNGDGSFKSQLSVSETGSWLDVGDFNSDGKEDYVVTSNGGPDSGYVALGNGDGTFRRALSLTPPWGSRDVRTGDFDADGNLDFATNSVMGFFEIHHGNGDGSFRGPVSYTGDLSEMRVSDLNGDGRDDIMGVRLGVFFTLEVILHNGDGFDAPSSISLPGDHLHGVAAADFNGDGAEDLAALAFFGGLRILAANTEETATAEVINLSTQEDARESIYTISRREERIAAEQGAIGAMQRRLQTAIGALLVGRENFDAAYSRISDIDVAEETAKLLKTQILQEVAASVSGQANQQPNLVLSLLK